MADDDTDPLSERAARVESGANQRGPDALPLSGGGDRHRRKGDRRNHSIAIDDFYSAEQNVTHHDGPILGNERHDDASFQPETIDEGRFVIPSERLHVDDPNRVEVGWRFLSDLHA